MKVRTSILTFLLIICGWLPLFCQDGSDIRYVKIKNLDNSFIGKFAHIDFFNKSFRGVTLDTVSIKVNGKSVRFIEHRQDDGFNNWFFEQYLKSVDPIEGLSIRIVKYRIDNIHADSLLVTNYLDYYDDKNELIGNKSKQETHWFKKEIIKVMLIKN